MPLKERRKQLSHIALTVRYSKADIEHLHPVDQPGSVDSLLQHMSACIPCITGSLEPCYLIPCCIPVHYSYKIGVMMGDAKEKTTFLYDAQYDGSTERACFTVNAVAGADGTTPCCERCAVQIVLSVVGLYTVSGSTHGLTTYP